MSRLLTLLVLAVAGAVAACGSDTGAPGPDTGAGDDTPAQTTPVTSTQEETRRPVRNDGSDPRVEEVAHGLEIPWDIAFLPGGGALVTERPGRIRLIDADGELQREPVARVSVRAEGEGGLMGIVLDPEFSEGQRFAYIYATTSEGNQVQRWRWTGDRLVRDGVVLGGIAAAPNHDAGRLRFGPDGNLYVPTGDAGQRQRAQDPDALEGKLLRLSPGQYRSSTTTPTIYSIGHRNAQGLAWQPGTGRLFESEHGPSGWDGPGGDDEINVIRRGANYGWPRVQGRAQEAGLTSPVWLWEDAVAPSGISFVTRPGSSWTGDLIVATLRGTAVRRLDVRGARVLSEHRVLSDRGRIRAIVEAPDGTIWATTSNRDDYGAPLDGEDDRVLRIVPPAG
jgi:glucose/arabinose dehydrogenase